MFWLEFQLILLSWPEACEAGLCPQVFGTFSFSSLLTEMWAGLAFNIHAEVAAFCDTLHMVNLTRLTNMRVTPCTMTCAAVL